MSIVVYRVFESNCAKYTDREAKPELDRTVVCFETCCGGQHSQTRLVTNVVRLVTNVLCDCMVTNVVLPVALFNDTTCISHAALEVH